MTDEEKQKRIKELEMIIVSLKKSYYSLTDEKEIEMSDAEYDLLEDELRKLDPNNKVLEQVGFEDVANGFKCVPHEKPMLSMAKAHTLEDITSWYNNKIDSCFLNENEKDLLIEPKIDGISGDIYYKNGKLDISSTRGTGFVGFEINSEFLSCIPKTIPITRDCHIRGEFYIPKIYRMKLGKDDDNNEPLRNICSGALKRKEKADIHNEVKIIIYQLVYDDDYDEETEEQKLELLKTTSFEVVPYYRVNDIVSAWKFFEEYEKTIRDSWEYETDGIILVFNSTNVQKKIVKELGDTKHHHKYAIAIKPEPEGAWTTLIGTEWNTGRTGRVVPVGIVDSIEIGSVVVNRATLNNITYIRNFDIQLFDRVMCVRANDVIPKITTRIHTAESREISQDVCPSCGTKLQMRGVDYWCPNYMECPDQRVNKFIYWFKVTGIKNLGPNMIDALISAGHFYALWELYAMSSEDLAIVVERYCNMNRNTDTMKEFIKTFEESKNQTEQEIIGNFGIPTIGIKTLEKLKIEDLNDLVKYKNVAYLRSDIVAEQKICQWLNQDDKNFDDLFSLIKFIKPKKTDKNKVVKEKFCITGEFKNKRRTTVIKEIEERYPNWQFENSVTKETSLLIIGNERGMSNKQISAMKYKTRTISLGEEFDINKLPNLDE